MENGAGVENLMTMYGNYLEKKEKDKKDKPESLKSNNKFKSLKKNNEIKSLKKIPIKNLSDFLNKYNIVSGPSSGFYNDIYYSLKKLENFLKTDNGNNTGITDPIKYLYHLYFEKILGAPTVYKEVGKFFHYKEYSKLNYLFREIFSWEVRTNGEYTNGRISAQQINDEKIKKQTEETKEMINEII